MVVPIFGRGLAATVAMCALLVSLPAVAEPGRTGTSMRLSEAIRLALSQNPSISQARWEAARQSATVDESKAAGWPTVVASAGYERWLDAQRLVPISEPRESGTFTHDIVSGDLRAHLPIYTGGAVSASIEAGQHRERAAKHALDRARQQVVFEVTSLFYEIIGQRRLLEAFDASRRALAEQRRVLSERIALDKAAPVDTLRLDVRIAELDQAVAEARNALSLRRRELAALLGMDPTTAQVDAMGDLQDEPVAPGSQTGTRSDILAAQTELAARRAEVDAARSGHWPSVDAHVGYGLRADFSGNVEDVGVAGVVVSLPLFEGGLTAARVRKAQATVHAGEERLRAARLRAQLEVQAAQLDVRTATERVAVSKIAIEQARRAFEIEREKLSIGRGTTTDVLDAHAALVKAQAAHFGNLTSLSVARAKLAYAKGEPVP